MRLCPNLQMAQSSLKTSMSTFRPTRGIDVRFGRYCGHKQSAGLTDFDANDPTETWAAQDFRSAKASFVPSLRRDIVLLAHDLRREGRMAIHIRRREFIFTRDCAAATWRLAARS